MNSSALRLNFLALEASLILSNPLISPAELSPRALTSAAAVEAAVRERLNVNEFTVQDLESEEISADLVVSVVLAGRSERLVLQPRSIRAPGFRVLAQDHTGALHEVAASEPTTYRGYVDGYGGSKVSACFRDGSLQALVSLGSSDAGTWVIEPLRGVSVEGAARPHVIYRSADVSPPPGICGNFDAPNAEAAHATPKEVVTTNMPVKVCQIACDADHEYYATNGSSVATTTAEIETILNGVSAIFERDTHIALEITQVIVHTAEPDPYTATTADGVLSQFRTEWNSNHADIPRDIAHLFTGRTFGTIIGNAYTDQVCPGREHYSLVCSRSQSNLGLRVAVSAHEIGHSFDAAHCDYDADPRCRIMCSNIGSCSTGIYSFEDSTVARIRAFAAGLNCLTDGAVATPTTSLPFSDDFSSYTYPPKTPDPGKWTGADLAQCEYGRLEISIGRGYNYNQKLGTVRTLPMPLSGTAQVSYKVNPQGIPTSQAFLVEYFDSTAFTWRTLRSITSDASTAYKSYFDTVPANGAGDYFAVRFSARPPSSSYTAAYTWMVDNVSIVAIPAAVRLAAAFTSTNTLVLSWPSTASAFSLQTNADLLPGGWGVLNTAPADDGTNKFVVLDPVLGARFFRLSN